MLHRCKISTRRRCFFVYQSTTRNTFSNYNTVLYGTCYHMLCILVVFFAVKNLFILVKWILPLQIKSTFLCSCNVMKHGQKLKIQSLFMIETSKVIKIGPRKRCPWKSILEPRSQAILMYLYLVTIKVFDWSMCKNLLCSHWARSTISESHLSKPE